MYELTFPTQPYTEQNALWPSAGQHILAHFDDHFIRVYQAFSPTIADYAVSNQHFGGAFSYQRMSWIKPNFLWMMYRSGWASKAGQERILAIDLPRDFFDQLLAQAVASQFNPTRDGDRDAWRAAIEQSDVRLQWDPDHAPDGSPVPRRAIQLGLRGETLRAYGQQKILAIRDITAFVTAQRAKIGTENLITPRERIYAPARAAAENVGLARMPA